MSSIRDRNQLITLTEYPLRRLIRKLFSVQDRSLTFRNINNCMILFFLSQYLRLGGVKGREDLIPRCYIPH